MKAIEIKISKTQNGARVETGTVSFDVPTVEEVLELEAGAEWLQDAVEAVCVARVRGNLDNDAGTFRSGYTVPSSVAGWLAPPERSGGEALKALSSLLNKIKGYLVAAGKSDKVAASVAATLRQRQTIPNQPENVRQKLLAVLEAFSDAVELETGEASQLQAIAEALSGDAIDLADELDL